MRQIQRFRKLAITYGFGGVSWWDWQETRKGASGGPSEEDHRGVPGAADSRYPTLSHGSRGDLVVWAQEHLKGAGESSTSPAYNGRGRCAREALPAHRRAVDVDGRIGAKTWPPLLA